MDVNTRKEFEVQLDPDTLRTIIPTDPKPDWARLEYHQCGNCPLDPAREPYCPAAVRIAPLVAAFSDSLSHQEAEVVVTTDERTISKRTTVQEGLTSLMGIHLVSSGCPILAHLRPMVRFHLPFASIEETIYRMASMYLMAQYFKMNKGMETDWEIRDLANLYAEIQKVNADLSLRMQNAAQKDASLNALVHLDIFAMMLNEGLWEKVGELERLFEPYLKTS